MVQASRSLNRQALCALPRVVHRPLLAMRNAVTPQLLWQFCLISAVRPATPGAPMPSSIRESQEHSVPISRSPPRSS
eukprot:15105745-Alexandrium_andersonii.AAC.1